MVTEQIAEIVRDGSQADRLEVWATGPENDSPTWQFADREVTRALIVAHVPPGADAGTILCGGFSRAIDDENDSQREILEGHLAEVVKQAAADWTRRGIDLTFWCGEAGEAIGRRQRIGFRPLALMHYRIAKTEAVVAAAKTQATGQPQSQPKSKARSRRPSGAGLMIEPIDIENPADRDRIVGLVDQTYQASLDCPAINEFRTAESTVDGYRESPQFCADLWMVAVDGQTGADAGVAIGSIHSNNDPVAGELVYLGLTPPFRGQGLSQGLLFQFVSRFKASGCQQIWVSHDAANQPAATLYDRHGFELVYRQQMWFRPHR